MTQQKGFSKIFLILIIIILAGVIGYFVLLKKGRPTVQDIAIPPTAVTPTPKPVIETSNLKTYQNTKFNFKINYPNNLVPIESVDCSITKEEDCSIQFSTSDVNRAQFSINAFVRPVDLSLEESANSLLIYFPKKDYTLQYSTVGSQRTVFVDVVDEKQRPDESGRVYFLKKGDDLISIFFPIGFNYSHILSSFIFIK